MYIITMIIKKFSFYSVEHHNLPNTIPVTKFEEKYLKKEGEKKRIINAFCAHIQLYSTVYRHLYELTA